MTQGKPDNPALEVIYSRRSVRAFQPKPLEKELIIKLLEAGRLAATARNEQPWHFIVVTDPQQRRKVADITDHGKFIADAAVCIAVFCQPTKYYLEDGSAATENILLAAHALGLGACWVAGDKKPYAGQIAQVLAVPNHMKLVSMIAIGYPGDLAPRPPKLDLQSVTHWERF